MRVPQNPLHLLVVLVLLFELVCVCELLFFARQEWLELLGGIGLPEAQVGVLGSGDDVLCVIRVENRVHLLHAFGVVDFAGASLVVWENSDRLVEACSHKLLACRCKVDIQNGRQVILVDHLGLLQLAHVKRVAVRVFITLK